MRAQNAYSLERELAIERPVILDLRLVRLELADRTEEVGAQAE